MYTYKNHTHLVESIIFIYVIIKLKYVGRDDGQKISCEIKTTDIFLALNSTFLRVKGGSNSFSTSNCNCNCKATALNRKMLIFFRNWG